jgi:hypothetical protein
MLSQDGSPMLCLIGTRGRPRGHAHCR